MTVDHRALLERIADVMNRLDFGAFREVFTDDLVTDFPQSGEVFRGLDNFMGTLRDYPADLGGGIDAESTRVRAAREEWMLTPRFTAALTPMFKPVRVEGSGDTGTAMFRIHYPDGSVWWCVLLYELRGQRIARNTTFFAPVLDPPDWRAPYRGEA